MSTQTVLLAFVAASACLVLLARLGIGRGHSTLPLPPGPKGLPFLGNAHQLLGKNVVSVLDGWAKEFGPLVHFKLFSTHVILISSSDAVRELMEVRYANYSGRPNFLLASEAMQDNMMMPFIHANERFRRVRKLVTTELRASAVTTLFNPIQEKEAHRLVHCMIQTPNEWVSALRRAIASILLTAVYNKPLRSGQETEGLVENVIRLNDELIAAIDGGKNLVDFLPWLRYIPFLPYKAEAAAYKILAESTYKALMLEAKEKYETGKSAEGIAGQLLRQGDIEADFREQYWALGAFYLAGSDTQAIATESLMMALALYPDVLVRAQAEVDSVVGDERCPSFEDEDRLPYIRAMIKEVLRWRPTGPTAIPHASVADDEYNGFRLPGGSIVMPNTWTIQMDPEVYADPETFNPLRYLDDPNLPLHAFGYGRRACPGKRVAESTLFVTFATIVWALDICPAIDPDSGRPVTLNSDRETGFSPVGLLRPLPFQVKITSRSNCRAQLLAAVVEDEGL